MEIAQRTVNFMANKISKGPKSINTGTKFPQDLRNLTPSTLLPLFPRSRVPVPAAGLFPAACGNGLCVLFKEFHKLKFVDKLFLLRSSYFYSNITLKKKRSQKSATEYDAPKLMLRVRVGGAGGGS